MVAVSDRDRIIFSLSADNCSNVPERHAPLRQLGLIDHPVHLLMDCAYEGDETRTLAVELSYFIPVVLRKRKLKILRTMTKSFTNSAIKAIKLNGFFIV